MFGLISELINVGKAASKERCFPEIGSIIYCDLFLGHADHSGIYVGDYRIVHLNGNGEVESVSFKKFLEGTHGNNQIYVSCKDGLGLCDVEIAERALEQVGKKREYNMLMNNCHQFVAGCITGDFENSNNFLWMLKHEAEKKLGVDDWRFACEEFLDMQFRNG